MYEAALALSMVSFILVQLDICDQQNHQTYNYLVKGHLLYMRVVN
jgi:hypothetical protein